MPNEPDVYKRMVGLRVPLELDAMVVKGFGKETDVGDTLAYIRALEEATRDVILDSADHKRIADKLEKNEAKRKARK